MGKRNYSKEYEIVVDFIKNYKDSISKGELNFLLGYAANLKIIMKKLPKSDVSIHVENPSKPSNEELRRNILVDLKRLVDFLGKGDETPSTASTKSYVAQMLQYLTTKGNNVSSSVLERMSYEIDMLYYMYDLPMRDDTDLPNYLKGRNDR